MATSGHISILIAKSQESVEERFKNGGWNPIWRIGEPTSKYPNGEPLDDGLIEGKNATISRVRSAEIPWKISIGVDADNEGFDVGIVGTDCLVDHPLEDITILEAFLEGREFNGNQSRLSIFAKNDSSIKTLEDLRANPHLVRALMTERPHLSQAFLSANGVPTEIWDNGSNYLRFAEEKHRQRIIPIKIIEGAGAQQLHTSSELLAMVGETGRRQRNYDLREIVKMCDIETLVLANTRSLENRVKRLGINQLVQDLINGAVRRETEGQVVSVESPSSTITQKERQ